MASRMQCHTIKYQWKILFVYSHLHSIFFWFFDSVIDVDVSKSRVIFHGHFFTSCLTTGRGPGVGVHEEWDQWVMSYSCN